MLWKVVIALLLAWRCNKARSINVSKTNLTAVYVFGDSVVDTGNNNYLPTISKVNYPPYGKDFKGGQPTGRFSNGLVPPDMIVQALGIKELLPPYLDPNLQDKELLTGINFASGANGYDPLTSELAAVISLPKQIELFEDYRRKLTQLTGDEEKTKAIVRDGLYIAVTGSNDITNTYFGVPFRQSHYDIPSYCDFLVSYASVFIQDLYKVGARRMGILGVPPIGCVPSQRTLRGGPNRECVKIYNQMAELFNSKLAAEIKSLNSKYADASIVYVDVYNSLLGLIRDHQKYGFRVATEGCCGTGKIEVAELCNKYTSTCANVSEYVFWDSFHPTQRAYGILVPIFLEQYLFSLL